MKLRIKLSLMQIVKRHVTTKMKIPYPLNESRSNYVCFNN